MGRAVQASPTAKLCAGESGADSHNCKDAACEGGKGRLVRQPYHAHQCEEVVPLPGQDADIPGSPAAQGQASLTMASSLSCLLCNQQRDMKEAGGFTDNSLNMSIIAAI